MSDRQNDLVYTDKQPAVRRMSPPNGLTFVCEIDHLNVIAVARSVTLALNRDCDLPMDLSQLEFCECKRHESLVNVAFDPGVEMWPLCPYDTDGLDREVTAEARRSPAFIVEESRRNLSADYRKRGPAETSLDAPLPKPPIECRELVSSPTHSRSFEHW